MKILIGNKNPYRPIMKITGANILKIRCYDLQLCTYLFRSLIKYILFKIILLLI